MILNIVDRRTNPYLWKKVDAVIEPTWHDNVIKKTVTDVAEKTPENWIGVEEKESISLADAITWASAHHDGVTLYLYDDGANR